MQHVIIGSRGSDLALWQAHHVKRQLENLGASVEIKVIITQGDAIQNLSFDKLEGKGFFTKEIELELLDKKNRPGCAFAQRSGNQSTGRTEDCRCFGARRPV
jgi:porphobilinogen deaminase